MLLKIYLAGVILSFLLSLIYYLLAVTDRNLVLDIIVALIFTGASWFGVFLYVISAKATYNRLQEKKDRRVNRGLPSMAERRKLAKVDRNDSQKKSVANPIDVVFSINRDQLN